jgi:hypothetical protein
MMMKRVLILMTIVLCFGCNNNKPDVSGITVNTKLERLDQFMFAKMDTSRIEESVKEMYRQFPFFAHDFVSNILGLPPVTDSSTAGITYSEMKRFMRLTRPLYDSIAPKFRNTSALEEKLKDGFRHVKYYYPAYNIPRLVAYVGPFDAPAVAMTPASVGIGLQLFAGKNFSFYATNEGQELYPMYISRRFEPQFIPAAVMNTVIQDLYPDQSPGRPLIEQMIIKGREWYLLDKLLPDEEDSIKTGYTLKQLKWANANEGLIWNFFLQNNDLYTTEPVFIKNFMGEAPYTEGMPEQSPGNIGQWVGWQIVKAYAANNPDMKPDEIMKQDPKDIFSKAKYKPR